MGRGGARIGAGRKPKAPAAAPVVVIAGAPGAPPWLSENARAVYAYYERELGDRMTPGDRDALASYATTLASIASIEAEMQRPTFQRTVFGEGGEKLHPLVAEHRQLLALAKGWATALGLTPTSRGRAKVATKTEVKRDWRAVVYQMPAR